MTSRRLFPVFVACSFVQAGLAASVSYDLTSGGVGQHLEDSAPNSAGSQVDTVFTTTIFVPNPGFGVNGDGGGPATGDANDYDTGESATFTITLDAIATSEAAARVFFTGIDFAGLGEDSPANSFEYFTVSSSGFTSFNVVDEAATAGMIAAEGFSAADFVNTAAGDELTGLSYDLGAVDVGSAFDLTVSFHVSPSSTGSKGSLARLDFDLTPIPEPGSVLLGVLGLLRPAPAAAPSPLNRRRHGSNTQSPGPWALPAVPGTTVDLTEPVIPNFDLHLKPATHQPQHRNTHKPC